MPELPEVETILRGLAPHLEGARIKEVKLNRQNLRYDFPKNFSNFLEGQRIISLKRCAKYLIFELDNGFNLLAHLGMSGNFAIKSDKDDLSNIKHLHVEFLLQDENGKNLRLIYIDARRFGFMDIFEQESKNKFLCKLGVEPLSNEFNAQYLADKFQNRKTTIKSALLNQQFIAGLGNIYVCEALWRAKINPKTPIFQLVNNDGSPKERLEELVPHIRDILRQAIKAGGSTISDFHNADGQSGYFQHYFDVYDREGENCNAKNCDGKIKRIVQSSRSSFYCPKCQT